MKNIFADSFKRAEEINAAIALIRRAARCNILAMPDENHVFVIMSYTGGREYWENENLLEAAISLVNTGCVELLEEAVQKAESQYMASPCNAIEQGK